VLLKKQPVDKEFSTLVVIVDNDKGSLVAVAVNMARIAALVPCLE
jgi:hypothetical protein